MQPRHRPRNRPRRRRRRRETRRPRRRRRRRRTRTRRRAARRRRRNPRRRRNRKPTLTRQPPPRRRRQRRLQRRTLSRIVRGANRRWPELTSGRCLLEARRPDAAARRTRRPPGKYILHSSSGTSLISLINNVTTRCENRSSVARDCVRACRTRGGEEFDLAVIRFDSVRNFGSSFKLISLERKCSYFVSK